MYRLLEVILALAPFAAYAAWRYTAADGGPPTSALIASGMGLALLLLALAWLAAEDRLPPGEVYVPPHIQDGRIVPAQTQPNSH